MAVAPLDKNGKQDLSHIVVAYAGTNRSDLKDIQTDIQSIGLGEKRILADSSTKTFRTSQFQTALTFAKEIEKRYPKAKVSTTGHSLGESIAMFVAVKQGYNNVGFNGPDIHNVLSEKQIKYMKQHKGQFHNYRNPHDHIGNITGNETGTAIYVDMPNKNGLVSDHNLTNWTFDKAGHLVDKRGNIVDLGRVYDSVELTVSNYMDKDFKSMKSRLSAGGYSAHETIFLDYEQASTVASGLGETAQTGCEQVKGYRDAAVQEAEDLWKEINKRPAFIEKLSDEEIMAIFAEEGVTYDSIVNSVAEHFDSKVKASQDLEESFTDLGRQIETGMQEMTARDNTLAGEIKGWIGGK